MTSRTRSVRPRDRGATEAAIVEAAKAVLAADGFQSFGINAVARAAGCDKQLVYRYFGGLDGLLDAVGLSIASWWADRLPPGQRGSPATYAELIEQLALGLLDALRGDRLMQRLVAWELADHSPAVMRLSAARSRSMVAWMHGAAGGLKPPPGVDAPAANAILVAAIQQIVLASAASGWFSGLSLRSDEDWERVRAALGRVVRALYPADGDRRPASAP